MKCDRFKSYTKSRCALILTFLSFFQLCCNSQNFLSSRAPVWRSQYVRYMQSGSNSLPYEIMYAKYGPSYWRSHEKVSGNLDIKFKKIIACVVTLSLYFSCSFAIQQPFNLAEKYPLKIRKVSINNSQVYLLYFYSVCCDTSCAFCILYHFAFWGTVKAGEPTFSQNKQINWHSPLH